MNNNFPDYDNPPLVEVVCGLSFEPLKDLKIPHYGLFWERIRKNYPNIEHAAPLGDLPETISSERLPIPRVWYIHSSSNNVIQLQNDRFLFNWRFVRAGDEYPRFENIKSSFQECIKLFCKFVEECGIGEISPLECELSYINHISSGDGWSEPAQIGNLFKDIFWANSGNRFLTNPVSVGWVAKFELPDNCGYMTSSIKQATRADTKTPMFIFENTSRGLSKDTDSVESIWDWFDVAHEWIVKGFEDLTTESAQKEIWRKKN